jgi:hypothetical protein
MVEAKSFVDQPPAQTLKLKVAEPRQSGIKIKLGAARESPSSTPGPVSTPGEDRQTPGVIVHNEALERQQKLVAAGMNGHRATTNGANRNLLSGSGVSNTPISSLTTHKSSRSTSAASPPRQPNGIKTEGATQSPAPTAAQIAPAAHHVGPYRSLLEVHIDILTLFSSVSCTCVCFSAIIARWASFWNEWKQISAE